MKQAEVLHIIHLTDIHGVNYLIDEIGSEIKHADLVILSGDITHFGGIKEAEKIINTIKDYNSSLLAVSGNCDYPEIEDYLLVNDINLHLTPRELAGFTFAGIGGSLPCPGTTPFEYSDDQAKAWLENIMDKLTGELPLIFISHQPPFNTVNDALPDGLHVGSKSIYNFICNIQPLICLTGHIHEGIGIDTTGKTKIVNPGPFRTGKYAKLEIKDKNSVEVILKQVTA